MSFKPSHESLILITRANSQCSDMPEHWHSLSGAIAARIIDLATKVYVDDIARMQIY